MPCKYNGVERKAYYWYKLGFNGTWKRTMNLYGFLDRVFYDKPAVASRAYVRYRI